MATALQPTKPAPTWSALQMRVLAAMDIELHVRRLAPAMATGASASGSWSEADRNSPLAAALARAAGAANVASFCARHSPLPELATLRREPGAKRALWRSLRSTRARS